MRAKLSVAALASLAVLAPAARALVCALDTVPAATLLLPYFEASLEPGAQETAIVLHNTGVAPAALNVTLWSDLGIPVLAVPVALSGYEEISFSLHELIGNGRLPASHLADFPLASFPGCANLLTQTTLAPSLLDQVQHALTGEATAAGLCYGSASPGVARGFVTVDLVHDCTLHVPSDTGYFVKGGLGIARNENLLQGFSFYVDQTADAHRAAAAPMVAIEAGGSGTTPGTAGSYSFYGRFVSWSAADGREALASDFGVRWQLGAEWGWTTDVLVWRDPRGRRNPFPCGSPPAPLTVRRATAISQLGAARSVSGSPFGRVTQRVRLYRGSGQSGLGIPLVSGEFGWLFLNLNHGAGSTVGLASRYRNFAQAWVTALVTTGPYLGAYDAVRYDSACAPQPYLRKP